MECKAGLRLIHDRLATMPTTNGASQSLIETTSGFVAGVVSTLVVHPLDVVKTRLQGTSVLA